MKANKDLKKGEILKLKFLKKINIGLIISCRLNSTRLPRKAIIKLGKTTSIERCINQVKQTGIKCIIIATSKKKENFRSSFLDNEGNIIAKSVPIINLGINPNQILDKKNLKIFKENAFKRAKNYDIEKILPEYIKMYKGVIK